MLRRLLARAEHLAESLLVLELELRRSRTNANRQEAFKDLKNVVGQIDALRWDAEILHATEKEEVLGHLDRKVAGIMRSPAYRVTKWLATYGEQLAWHLGNETVDPLQQLGPC